MPSIERPDLAAPARPALRQRLSRPRDDGLRREGPRTATAPGHTGTASRRRPAAARTPDRRHRARPAPRSPPGRPPARPGDRRRAGRDRAGAVRQHAAAGRRLQRRHGQVAVPRPGGRHAARHRVPAVPGARQAVGQHVPCRRRWRGGSTCSRRSSAPPRWPCCSCCCASSAPARSIAAATAATFAVTYTFWSQAVVAEVYTLHLLLLGTLTLCLARWRYGGSVWWLRAGLAVLALSFGNHLGTSLAVPGVLWVVLSDRRRSRHPPQRAVGRGLPRRRRRPVRLPPVDGRRGRVRRVPPPRLVGRRLGHGHRRPVPATRMLAFGPGALADDRVPMLARLGWRGGQPAGAARALRRVAGAAPVGAGATWRSACSCWRPGGHRLRARVRRARRVRVLPAAVARGGRVPRHRGRGRRPGRRPPGCAAGCGVAAAALLVAVPVGIGGGELPPGRPAATT